MKRLTQALASDALMLATDYQYFADCFTKENKPETAAEFQLLSDLWLEVSLIMATES